MLKTFATICIIGMFTSSCTSKKASRTEGSHEAEQDLTMIVGTYTSGDSKGLPKGKYRQSLSVLTLRETVKVSIVSDSMKKTEPQPHSVKRKWKTHLISYLLPTANSSMQSANSATNKLLPTHLLSIRRKELSDC